MAEQSSVISDAPRPKAIYWVVSLGLAGVLLYYSLRGVEWGRVWRILQGAEAGGVALGFALMTGALALRSIRWRVLLSMRHSVSIADAYWATSAGYLGNNFLPARAGEVIRTLMISRRTGLSRTFVLTTALCERVVDAITLVIISSVVLLIVPEQPGWLAEAAEPMAFAGLCAAAVLVLAPPLESFWLRVIDRIPMPGRLKGFARYALEQGLEGVRSFHDRGRFARFVGLTAVIWCVDAVVVTVLATAINVHISMPVAFLLIAGLGLGSALPSTPGYVGIYQFVAVSVLTPFGLTRNEAIAHILLFQAMIYVTFLCWGSIGAWRGSRAANATQLSAG